MAQPPHASDTVTKLTLTNVALFTLLLADISLVCGFLCELSGNDWPGFATVAGSLMSAAGVALSIYTIRRAELAQCPAQLAQRKDFETPTSLVAMGGLLLLTLLYLCIPAPMRTPAMNAMGVHTLVTLLFTINHMNAHVPSWR
jgi:hypothetical protein